MKKPQFKKYWKRYLIGAMGFITIGSLVSVAVEADFSAKYSQRLKDDGNILPRGDHGVLPDQGALNQMKTFYKANGKLFVKAPKNVPFLPENLAIADKDNLIPLNINSKTGDEVSFTDFIDGSTRIFALNEENFNISTNDNNLVILNEATEHFSTISVSNWDNPFTSIKNTTSYDSTNNQILINFANSNGSVKYESVKSLDLSLFDFTVILDNARLEIAGNPTIISLGDNLTDDNGQAQLQVQLKELPDSSTWGKNDGKDIKKGLWIGVSSKIDKYNYVIPKDVTDPNDPRASYTAPALPVYPKE